MIARDVRGWPSGYSSNQKKMETGAPPANSARPNAVTLPPFQPKPLRGLGRRFGDLKVRPKLMVLHNLFFLVLASAVYFSLVPLVETRLAEARTRETHLITRSFDLYSGDPAQSDLTAYGLTSGTADELGVPTDVRSELLAESGRVWRNEKISDYLYKYDARTGLFHRVRLPLAFFDNIVGSVKVMVFAVLGAIYVLAVLVLELMIMPVYVYQPLRVLLDAEKATLEGDRRAEIIQPEFIPGDEIGQIMQSRNDTVQDLRRREDELEMALLQLEATAEDLKRKNEMLEAAKQKLEAQDRLVSLGMLSASVAHEINTPLAVLHGSIEKLMETVDSAGAQSRLRRMIRVTERLRRISEGLLDFARVRQREMQPVLIAPLIDDAWGLVAIDEKASEVCFTNNVPPDTAVVGNADRLVQVFVNLIRNSLNAVPSGGKIQVTAREASLGASQGVAIAVEDNGPGIPQEVLPEIFDAFVTTRLDARGTGLGLTVAEGIVNQHGGTITASNCPSGGARLEVTLPAAAAILTGVRT